MKTLIVTILAVLTMGCGKENFDPTFNDFSLIGLWVSDDGRYTLDIKNVKGEGEDIKYFEVYENGQRYLREIKYGISSTWVIVRITPDELHLNDTRGNVTSFWRAD